MLRFHHIIWDFDGTICDTAPALIRAYALAMEQVGVHVSPETVREHIHGTLTRYSEMLAEKHGFDVAEQMEHYWNHLHQVPVEGLKLFPGVLDVLERVQKMGGKQYILTHHRYPSLKRFLDGHRLNDFFAEIVTPENGFPRKPDPAGFRYLIDKYAMHKNDVLAIGDREPDILAAQAVGIATCLFGPEPLDGLQPDHFISSYDQIRPLLFTDANPAGDSS